MEFYISIQIIAFFITVVAFLLHLISKQRATRGKGRKPPQPKGAWPVIGHLHLLAGESKLPHMIWGEVADQLGPIFTVKLGVKLALVVSNAEIAKECLTTNDKVFASRPKSVASELMAYNYALFGSAPFGDYWRKMRKIIMLEVLSQSRVEMLGHIRVSEIRASINDIYEGWLNNHQKSKVSNMVKVEMSQWFGNLILNIMVMVITGRSRFSVNDEQGAQLIQMVIRKYFDLYGGSVVFDLIPYFRILNIGGYKQSMKDTAKELDNIFAKWLKERKFKRKCENQSEGNKFFIDVLIDILQGESEDELNGFDRDTVIKSTCQQLLTAGTDTTSSTLTWALSLLVNNPKALEIAQCELDEQVGRKRLVEESDLKNLVYLNAIIKETMRLYPPGGLSLPHESTEDCIVNGYHIPKGTILLVNLWKIHRDRNIWSDPNEFRPERFMKSHKDVDVKGNHFELIPFGSGRRMCPGVLFALKALSLTLASLLQQFVLKNPSQEPVDMTEIFGMTNSKATPLEVLLAPRLSSDMYHIGS
ncbi:cytochrome P450 CYP82D47-like [Rutidosis leptorrhynchoides]|uniref:cytochrome P450 CYP82D47-like n=1 Tax=Rutidosis leptorrhynchoides TaxID=125765 RepID=UPI003A99A230